MSASSSARTSALATAALASSRSAKTYPRPPPTPRTNLRVQPAQGSSSEFNGVDGDADGDFGEGSGLSSQDRRLSRAARYGASSSSTPISMSTEWNDVVEAKLTAADRLALRQDYLALLRRGKIVTKDKKRRAILHLVARSPSRYAALYSVLRQVRTRLGPDEEGLGSDVDAWTPSRVVEYRCRAAEGLWAAVEVFGGAQTMEGRGLRSYTGFDMTTAHIVSANHLIDEARRDLRLDQVRSDPPDTTRGAIQRIHVSLKPHHHQRDDLATKELNPAPPKPSPHRDTLVISSYALSALATDSARMSFIQALWQENPSAEVAVFIEDGNERGFACIASARERLLAIGKNSNQGPGLQIGRHTFYDGSERDDSEKETDSDWPQGWRECHVVAPCPHDRACPLLHDFEFLEPPTVLSPRSSSASSPLFHGASLGMGTCSFPNRFHRPSYMKETTRESRPDESGRFSYLIVRRGPRPTVAQKAKSMSATGEASTPLREDIRKRAEKTKKGDIEAIRAGSRKDAVVLGEEVGEEGGDAATAVMTAEDMDEPLARAELLKLLPQALAEEMQEGKGEGGAEMEEAVRLAQEMIEKSAKVADEPEPSDGGEESAHDDSLLASSFIDQARQLSESGEEGGEEDATTEEPVLLAEDVDAMRVEAHQWPRLVKTAIKKSGHVTFDVCSCSGSIDRFTVSKSSGKQVFQDARKSNHGDLFPHVPFSDEEATPAMVKSLVTRVPPASDQRGSLPATIKPGRDVGKPGTVPLASWNAIGADRVLGHRANKDKHWEKAETFSRREHYRDGGERQERRHSRKKSTGYYDRAIQEAWRQ